MKRFVSLLLSFSLVLLLSGCSNKQQANNAGMSGMEKAAMGLNAASTVAGFLMR